MDDDEGVLYTYAAPLFLLSLRVSLSITRGGDGVFFLLLLLYVLVD
jgi:hypothetical protein